MAPQAAETGTTQITLIDPSTYTPSVLRQIHIGVSHAGRTLTIEDADTTFRVHGGNQLLTEVPRTTTKPITLFRVVGARVCS